MAMSSASFQGSTEILRRLGEELNPSPDRGILELVKKEPTLLPARHRGCGPGDGDLPRE